MSGSAKNRNGSPIYEYAEEGAPEILLFHLGLGPRRAQSIVSWKRRSAKYEKEAIVDGEWAWVPIDATRVMQTARIDDFERAQEWNDHFWLITYDTDVKHEERQALKKIANRHDGTLYYQYYDSKGGERYEAPRKKEYVDRYGFLRFVTAKDAKNNWVLYARVRNQTERVNNGEFQDYLWTYTQNILGRPKLTLSRGDETVPIWGWDKDLYQPGTHPGRAWTEPRLDGSFVDVNTLPIQSLFGGLASGLIVGPNPSEQFINQIKTEMVMNPNSIVNKRFVQPDDTLIPTGPDFKIVDEFDMPAPDQEASFRIPWRHAAGRALGQQAYGDREHA